MAEGLDVQTGVMVKKVARADKGWVVGTRDDEYHAKAIILTAPIPHSFELLDAGGINVDSSDRKMLESVKYTPCITVNAVLEGASGLTEWGGLRIFGTFIDWIADNRLKGISPDVHAVTVQGMPEFSRIYWEENDEDVARLLLDNAKALLVSPVKATQVVRWQLSKPLNPHPDAYYTVSDDTTPLLIAGDGFRGHRVEGAVISGIEASEKVLAAIQ
jgi:predicted NAD/FAD-dependent oxidoreductase